MSAPSPSLRVHRIVEYIKSVGFWMETDEVEWLGAQEILRVFYELELSLTPEEWDLLEAELLTLAEENEIREAERKRREREPEDSGVMLFRQAGSDETCALTSHALPYSYPVDENLRQIRPRKGPSFSLLEKKSLAGTGTEVN